MKKLSKALIGLRTLLTLLGLLVLSTVLFYFLGGLNIKNVLIQNPIKHLKPVPPSEYNGWIAWWDETNALESITNNSKVLKSVSPLWLRINNLGDLEIIPHKDEAKIISILKDQKVKIIPTLTNDFDSKRISFILNNTDIQRGLEENLKTLVLNSQYDGIDIDWEEIDPKDQEIFTFFIKNLSETFHQAELIVTLSVHPQTGKPSDRKVAKGYDLKALSQSVDAIKIMAYDFHNQNSQPGAITPFTELNAVLSYTSSLLPTEKIILGLPVYGYDWELNSKKVAEAVSFNQAIERIESYNGNILRDEESNALIGNYTVEGKEHIIWYEDAQTVAEYIKLARDFGIYQFTFWRLGVEDPKLFNLNL